jgi:hypothetical protein
MVTKRRKRAPKAPTAASFTRALRDAEKRLAKAIEDRTRTITQLALLNTEIPTLQGIIRALGGEPQAATDLRRCR